MGSENSKIKAVTNKKAQQTKVKSQVTENTLISQPGDHDLTGLSISKHKLSDDKRIINTLDFKKSQKFR